MGRKGGWGAGLGREAAAIGSLGRKRGWGGREARAGGSQGRRTREVSSGDEAYSGGFFFQPASLVSRMRFWLWLWLVLDTLAEPPRSFKCDCVYTGAATATHMPIGGSACVRACV